ncbi:MAG: hypothetical protein NVS9B4_09850 [Candidatus Acidiferrum sp.]
MPGTGTGSHRNTANRTATTAINIAKTAALRCSANRAIGRASARKNSSLRFGAAIAKAPKKNTAANPCITAEPKKDSMPLPASSIAASINENFIQGI